jgi:DNA-directed RNA polymerase subunit beta'
MYEIHILSKIFVPLQRSIDQLIDNARTDEPRKRKLHSVPFKSLTEGLETKEGRFRLNLFGKRVNYSARSVIVVGPYLRINQCAIPYKIAKTLFAPLLQRKVLELQRKNAIYHPIIAQNIIRLDPLKIYQILCILAEEYSVLLNRAPTLHKFGIQSFEPLITLTQAIELHPLVCTGFNADFDGDQMGLYLPFYKLSQFEILSFMKSSSNMFSPTNGEPVLKPTQDMVIGAHYLTSLIAESQDFSPEYFSNEDQVIMRFYQKKCSIHTRVLVNYSFQNERYAIE